MSSRLSRRPHAGLARGSRSDPPPLGLRSPPVPGFSRARRSPRRLPTPTRRARRPRHASPPIAAQLRRCGPAPRARLPTLRARVWYLRRRAPRRSRPGARLAGSQLADGRRLERFVLAGHERTRFEAPHGPGTRAHAHRHRPRAAHRTTSRHRAAATATRVSPSCMRAIRNLSSQRDQTPRLDQCRAAPAAAGAARRSDRASEPPFWSYCGSTHADRRDWVQPLRPGFSNRTSWAWGLRLRWRHPDRRCVAQRLRRCHWSSGADAGAVSLPVRCSDTRRAARPHANRSSACCSPASSSTHTKPLSPRTPAITSACWTRIGTSWVSVAFNHRMRRRPRTSRSGAPGAMSATARCN